MDSWTDYVLNQILPVVLPVIVMIEIQITGMLLKGCSSGAL